MKKGELAPVLVNIGFGNVVAASRVVAIVTPGSAPMKRLREEAKKTGKLLDATEGRRTRSIIVTDSNHIILSAIQAETITQRFLEGTGANIKEDERQSFHRFRAFRRGENYVMQKTHRKNPGPEIFRIFYDQAAAVRRNQ